jgi:acyl-CoA thioesterase FadM
MSMSMMQPTTLAGLLAEGDVRQFASGLEVVVRRAWILADEDRLAYTAIVRLVECCREWHWQADILPHAAGAPLDSITKSLTAVFSHPMMLGSMLRITHQVVAVRPRSYQLRFTLATHDPDQPGQPAQRAQLVQDCATLDMVSVFYDPDRAVAAEPPPGVLAYLHSCVAETQSDGASG